MKRVDILFIIPPFHMRNGGGDIFPLGIGYIIASINKSYHTWGIINCEEYITSFYEEDLVRLRNILPNKMKSYSPRVIGIGPCITVQIKALKIIADACMTTFPGTPVFAGGPFATINGQDRVFFDIIGIDYLIKGDGELAVSCLIDDIKEGKTIESCESISFKGRSIINYISDINALPFPFRLISHSGIFSERRKEAGKHQFAMIASRGCPYQCRYCVSGNMKDNGVEFRRRSIENIIEEMVFLRDTYAASSIVFYDDLFFSNRKSIDEEIELFCKELVDIKANLTWQIEMRPDFFVLISDNSLKMLKKSGCSQINLGIEKISKKSLLFLGKSSECDGLIQKMHKTNKLGIRMSATFILGGKDERRKDIIDLIMYAKKLPLCYAHFNPLFVYPGTPLYYEFFEDDLDWAYKVLNDKLPWGEIIYENEYLNRQELLELIDYAYAEFYNDTQYVNSKMVIDRFNINRARRSINEHI